MSFKTQLWDTSFHVTPLTQFWNASSLMSCLWTVRVLTLRTLLPCFPSNHLTWIRRVLTTWIKRFRGGSSNNGSVVGNPKGDAAVTSSARNLYAVLVAALLTRSYGGAFRIKTHRHAVRRTQRSLNLLLHFLGNFLHQFLHLLLLLRHHYRHHYQCMDQKHCASPHLHHPHLPIIIITCTYPFSLSPLTMSFPGKNYLANHVLTLGKKSVFPQFWVVGSEACRQLCGGQLFKDSQFLNKGTVVELCFN